MSYGVFYIDGKPYEVKSNPINANEGYVGVEKKPEESCYAESNSTDDWRINEN